MRTIGPADFYRCIMSPNMMLARTRPLQLQGPFFILLCLMAAMAYQAYGSCRPGKRSATGQSITAYAQSRPRAAGQGTLLPFYCCRSGRGNQPAIR
ncbi:hypothetical protein CO701_12775 [Citrobacter werkmanii]|nr:hypothetical protein CO701_12775 [Citrobacter werkmanii]